MTDVLHSLSVKLNLPNHLATLSCFIEGITNVVHEVVVTPWEEEVAGVDNQEEVVTVIDSQGVEPPKGVKRGAGYDQPPSNLPASRIRTKHPQISWSEQEDGDFSQIE